MPQKKGKDHRPVQNHEPGKIVDHFGSRHADISRRAGNAELPNYIE